jgi:hypothetical protein
MNGLYTKKENILTPSLVNIRYLNGVEQYSENDVSNVFKTVEPLKASSAVTSIKTLRVATVIFECLLLIIGGKDNTVPFASRITG